MSFALRKSTAGQVVQFKMVDSTTGLKKTGLTIANTDIKLIFEGGTTQTSKNSGGATEIGSTGVYYATFDATDTATLGKLRADIEVAGALPWFADWMVLTATAWDAIYAASGGYIPAILADAVSHGGTLGSSTATLALSRINVTSQTSNTVGVTVAGNGSGDGTTFTGGAAVTSTAAGNGVSFVGGASSATSGGVAGIGMKATGGAGSSSNNGAAIGVKFIGGGTNTVASAAHGFQVTGTSTGDGLSATSGAGATGNGITATAASSNGSGMAHVSTGTGSGILTDTLKASGAVTFGSTFTVTGAVAFSSTFAVTTSTALGAISGSTLTLSGAVAFQSTFAVTTSTALGAISGSTLTLSGAVAFQSTFVITGATTFTGNVGMSAGLNITQSTSNTAALVVTGNGSGNGATFTGGAAVTSTAAGHGVSFVGGASSATSGGTAGIGVKGLGGAGSASNNGAGDGSSFVGGGTTTVAGGNGMTLTHTGSGKDFNATTTPLTLAKTTNITGFNDITAASVSTAVWSEPVPASFTSGQAGNVLGNIATGTPPTAAAIATAVWTDTTASDFTVLTSPGKIIFAQLGGAFTTTSSSVFTVGALANAPTGGSAPTVGQIATAVWQDATGSDFTTTGSIGKSLFTSGNAPGAASGLALVGSSMDAATFAGSVPVQTSGKLWVLDGSGNAIAPASTVLTAAAAAAGVWRDAVAGDFTVSGSIGKSLGGAFTALGTSVYSVAALANAPGGGGAVTVGGYSSGQDPATLVLDVLASLHNTAGTIGAKINSAGSAADPLANAVPGTYLGGTAGYVLGHLSPLPVVSLHPPVDAYGNMFLRIGDDYLLASGNEVSIASTGIWPDLTGATITLELWQPVQATTRYSFAGVVETPTGNQQVYVDLTHTQTATITAGQYAYRIQATLAASGLVGVVITLFNGVCLVTSP